MVLKKRSASLEIIQVLKIKEGKKQRITLK